jgi:hypothetical protein
MWITNEGLKCHSRDGKKSHVVTFAELADFLNKLTETARFLSDTDYRKQVIAKRPRGT